MPQKATTMRFIMATTTFGQIGTSRATFDQCHNYQHESLIAFCVDDMLEGWCLRHDGRVGAISEKLPGMPQRGALTFGTHLGLRSLDCACKRSLSG